MATPTASPLADRLDDDDRRTRRQLDSDLIDTDDAELRHTITAALRRLATTDENRAAAIFDEWLTTDDVDRFLRTHRRPLGLEGDRAG